MEKDVQLIKKMIEYAKFTGSFHRNNLIQKADHVCVYGLGKYFHDVFLKQNVQRRFHVDCICDSNSVKIQDVLDDPRYNGLTGIRLEDLGNYRGSIFVIVMIGGIQVKQEAWEVVGERVGLQNCVSYDDLALDDLICGDPCYRDVNYFSRQEQSILAAYDLLKDEQSRLTYVNTLACRMAPQFIDREISDMWQYNLEYFKNPLYEFANDESFVDAGACNGDTLESFLKIMGERFRDYYLFEMDKENCQEIEKKKHQLNSSVASKIRLYRAAVWDENGTISYGTDSSSEGHSIFESKRNEECECVKLDTVLGNNRVTAIKMDIEGAEQWALRGCENILKRSKPKMAVCVYHRLEDLWKVPLYLKKIVPEYQICICHHPSAWMTSMGTICYAKVDTF